MRQPKSRIGTVLTKLSITGYIGDLKDGVHRGDENDPRVAVIEVIPDEIKYWISKHSAAIRTAQVAANAAMGKATSPGELRIISKEEVSICLNNMINQLNILCIDPACAGIEFQVVHFSHLTSFPLWSFIPGTFSMTCYRPWYFISMYSLCPVMSILYYE